MLWEAMRFMGRMESRQTTSVSTSVAGCVSAMPVRTRKRGSTREPLRAKRTHRWKRCSFFAPNAQAAMLVRDEATDRQIWMTAVGMPVLVFPLHLDVSFE